MPRPCQVVKGQGPQNFRRRLKLDCPSHNIHSGNLALKPKTNPKSVSGALASFLQGPGLPRRREVGETVPNAPLSGTRAVATSSQQGQAVADVAGRPGEPVEQHSPAPAVSEAAKPTTKSKRKSGTTRNPRAKNFVKRPPAGPSPHTSVGPAPLSAPQATGSAVDSSTRRGLEPGLDPRAAVFVPRAKPEHTS
ncbi:uncharacterized protein BDZ99DRAFT_470869 [Mytilinidion resinicola]|uniref:Uncharacterized protein n=1 Tax=Mytilinidion resinicola TaxID=574789 RepID=A0A6A6ZC83_9PEZI|nr:uncharacterized protein BDZ99DRAFT_470869 [Mytilinidion resinicola]KAF2817924.1 hypothetical protein BDZ99DRAFT_470869 [Mytilinidion resinicola]